MHQRYLGMGSSFRRLLRKPLLVRNAAEHVLMEEPGRDIEQAGRRAAAVFKRARHLPVDVAVHAVDDFGPERSLGDVGVDVDNEIVVTLLFGGVREDVARIGMDRDLGKFTHPRRPLPIPGSIPISSLVGFVAVLGAMGRLFEHRFLHQPKWGICASLSRTKA